MDIDKAINLAIDNVLKEGLTDIFPRPFEVDLLKSSSFRNDVFTHVKKSIESKSLDGLGVLPISHVLLPKTSVFDFRRCALMHPTDTVKFLALSILVAQDTEQARVSTRKRRVFSYRYKPQKGYLFNRQYNITSFVNESRKRAKMPRNRILVKCDIANFYDRLNLHRLESILISLQLDKWLVNIINNLLIFWAGQNSYGLPVGSNASRILAEASLIEVDEYLISHEVNFIRFVDDFRFFAPNAEMAHYWLSLLIERLSLEGLSLNSSKTSVSEIKDSHQPPSTPPPKTKAAPKGKGNQSDSGKNTVIIHGYGGAVPLKFREISLSEQNKLSEKTGKSILKAWKETLVFTSEEIQEFCKVILYNKEWKMFNKLPEITAKFPQLTPYVVDMLVKYMEAIPSRICNSIADQYADKLQKASSLPEYLTISYVRLLGAEKFARREAILFFIRQLKRNAGPYIGRAAIDAIHDIALRRDIIEIRSYFDRSDLWEKRSIIRLVGDGLPVGEKRAWMKNIYIPMKNDLFSKETIRPSS